MPLSTLNITGREALEALDGIGWQRSFHQRLFHDHFIRACARIFWKTEPPGSFAKDHQKILEMNGWDHLSQEILVSTPRRHNKPVPALVAHALAPQFLRRGDGPPALCARCLAPPANVYLH